MFYRFVFIFIVFFASTFNALSLENEKPYVQSIKLNIGKDTHWRIDKIKVTATKSVADDEGRSYHLQFNNTALKLMVRRDAASENLKSYNHLEIIDVKIDGKQSPLFKWCLNHQQQHNRFIQQGLLVKKNICFISHSATFVMHLDEATLLSLQQGRRLKITLKTLQVPLELNYDIRDFKDMYLALNSTLIPVGAVVSLAPNVDEPFVEQKELSARIKCWTGPPAMYKTIKSVEYDCANVTAKNNAEAWIVQLVNQEKMKEKKWAEQKAREGAAQKAKQQQRVQKRQQQQQAEREKQKRLVAQKNSEEARRVEASAIAASLTRQKQIATEIRQKMVRMCDKFWRKGEHRCYCQKYIGYAPNEIKANASCE
ncbi:MAG: hypothetical protein COB77_00285 [Gammaproteobacteria bacterium]|nr:MAG: hypothetical protein COB77_00285 [Gammaproteobacteria bacterium]